jgi:hypothetical protein
MKENGKCSRLERMASLLFAEKGGEFAKNGVSSSAQNRGRTMGESMIHLCFSLHQYRQCVHGSESVTDWPVYSVVT